MNDQLAKRVTIPRIVAPVERLFNFGKGGGKNQSVIKLKNVWVFFPFTVRGGTLILGVLVKGLPALSLT